MALPSFVRLSGQPSRRMHTPQQVGDACRPTQLYPYSAHGTTDTWDILKQADQELTSTRIRLVYTNYRIRAGAAGDEHRSGWNREHCWPRSLAPMSAMHCSMGTDVHNLFCADPSINSSRGNRWFDDGGQPVVDTSPAPAYSGRTRCRADSDSWEPRDGAKGVIARAIFYMACAYAAQDLRISEAQTGRPYEMGRLSTLLAWNEQHPVTEWERRRNRVIGTYQGNLNPFIECPTLANRVYWQ